MPTDHDHGDGLHEDLVKLATRRDALSIFGAGSAAAILTTLGASSALAATPTGEVPSETAGPYPGDGSNGVVRHDNVFRDDKAIHQLATVTGSVSKGYVANLTIGI